MKITDILNEREITISLELFPPKPGKGFENIKKVVQECALLSPSYMSVTFGAGGGGSQNTLEVVKEVQQINNITALAHLVAVSLGREEISGHLNDLKAQGISNIIALRGDLPPGETENTGYYRYASDLIREIHKNGDFCVGGGCHPEGHPEAQTLQQDIENLKIKVDAGCQFLTTQMFFDNNILYNFMFRLLKNGINVPVIAGIMPVTNSKQIERIFKLSGAPVPPRFKAIVDRFSNNPRAMRQAGIAYATEQIIDLIANGISNIHIYTMNKPEIARSIMKNLSEIFVTNSENPY
ncbi:MAG: methylenetetrahydrofolate reductase [Defluviitaleaceae bacterium]|nr:methylenetetrahydrofolate reductase [Defluviitaleaceae bacterium]